ncbi:MAG: DUF2802 domain-containing protein [Gammaproteobacteria bacterium]|nr:DUF2802 domain-containing protein [Gammaproteobacteria bacterium]
MNLDNLVIVLLIVLMASVFASIYALVSVMQLRKHFRNSDTFESRLVGLQNDIRALTAGAAGLGKKLHSLESGSRRVQERQNQIEVNKSDGRPYEQAIRMAQNGASVDELMTVCEFSRSEAELIVMMHRLDKAG